MPSARHAVDGPQHVRRVAAGRDRDRDVAGAAERLHLAREDLVVAVVVGDGGERRGVGGERDRRQRAPLARHATDELGGDVLRVGRAAAVAEEQQLVPAAEGVRDEVDRSLEVGRVLGEEDALRVHAVVEERADGVLRRGHGGAMVGSRSRCGSRTPSRAAS